MQRSLPVFLPFLQLAAEGSSVYVSIMSASFSVPKSWVVGGGRCMALSVKWGRQCEKDSVHGTDVVVGDVGVGPGLVEVRVCGTHKKYPTFPWDSSVLAGGGVAVGHL